MASTVIKGETSGAEPMDVEAEPMNVESVLTDI